MKGVFAGMRQVALFGSKPTHHVQVRPVAPVAVFSAKKVKRKVVTA